ncbi:hypothetical protein PCANC_23118 [Puccinia coronata f. sp. avenae]|uniref:HAT C-terminal dimerisation domain-containing protein n=1 Tax=Puccinia coronata f. sp. avenae TaxID=200324 RepID=A0A2N5TSS0_9BASI|nr:hypothetical protein PCANC_23118 [Puccinia coronata f. sp. avenae]
MTFWRDNARFIQENYSKSLEDILATFHQVAKTFGEDITPAAPTPEIEESSSKGNLFQRRIFSTTKEVDSLDDEIKTYLREETEKSKKDILCYWKGRQDSFPTLAKMARCFLAIPATSAPSERVFSKGQSILSWERSSLKPNTVAELLCLKDWYKVFGGPVPLDSASKILGSVKTTRVPSGGPQLFPDHLHPGGITQEIHPGDLNGGQPDLWTETMGDQMLAAKLH